ncbi:hypothetical protein [Hyalangium sp.]|uniref:hypothetical protein n=1 Tax=Hyalangium sp. TaxID=2028555 RepID=UPI002D7622D6|nr:hypothetical protein [Hyalangium sp.]HYH95755.1 hypothetical protein [Hyalangium sp.]
MPVDFHARQALAGALLLGTSALSGNATLIASAGAIGVNWTSEALARLWQKERSALVPGTHVQRVAAKAIRRAAKMLKTLHKEKAGPHAQLLAFDLIHDCADAVAESAPLPTDSLTPATAEDTLHRALDSLLFDHDTKAVEFLKKNLLGTVARTFREELAADTQAWQAFHGMLIEQLGENFGTLSQTVERLPELMARFAQPPNALEALQGSAERLEVLIAQFQQTRAMPQATAPAISFENEDLHVGGSLSQAGGDIVEGRETVPPSGPPPLSSAMFKNKQVQVRGDVHQAAGNIVRGQPPSGASQGLAPTEVPPRTPEPNPSLPTPSTLPPSDRDES